MADTELSLPFPEDPWGPHREAVSSRLATCADFLGRLERSLTGEAAPDRHDFSTRAHDLYEAARDLVRLGQEVEHWLIVCNEPVPQRADEQSLPGTCELPRNHYGGHDDEPPASLAVQVRNSARVLMDEAEETAIWVELLGLRSDQRRAFGREASFDPEYHELLDALEQTGSVLVYKANKVNGLLHALAAEVPQEDWDGLDDYVDEEEFEVGDEARSLMSDRVTDVPLPPARRARGLDL